MASNLSIYPEQLSVARIMASKGNCKKRNYGCAIFTSHGHLVNIGVTHAPHECKKCKREKEKPGHGYDRCPSIHAEQHALLNAIIPAGSVAFLACFDAVTREEIVDPKPCPTCVKLLKEAGIREVITIKEVIKL